MEAGSIRQKISIVIYAYFMMEKAREMGLTLYVANGQVAAKGFYEKLGFIAEGEIFLDAGIEHIRMIRRE